MYLTSYSSWITALALVIHARRFVSSLGERNEVSDISILVNRYFKLVLFTMGSIVFVNLRKKLPEFPPLPYVAGVPWSDRQSTTGSVTWSEINMEPYVSPYVDFRVVTLNPGVDAVS